MTSQELTMFKELIKEIVQTQVKESLKEVLPGLLKKDLREIKLLLAKVITEGLSPVQPDTFINKAEKRVIKEQAPSVDINAIRNSRVNEHVSSTYTHKAEVRPIGSVDPLNGILPDIDVPFNIDMTSDIFKDIQDRE